MKTLECLFGTYINDRRVTFVIEADDSTKECAAVLFDLNTEKEVDKLVFSPENKLGKIYWLDYEITNNNRLGYYFTKDGEAVADEYGKAFLKQDYATPRNRNQLQAILPEAYSWGEDKSPMIPYSRSILYQLHVRGFTMDESSGIAEKGTFLGVTKKLTHLKKCGFTSLVFQPIYEFLESEETEYTRTFSFFQEKLNYWGYKEGFYFAPKSNYAYTDNPAKECKDMIKAIHKQGMEVILQMYYPKTVPSHLVLASLLYWSEEYHADGFVLMGEQLPKDEILKNPMLTDKKLIFEEPVLGGNGNVASLDYDYYYTMRRFLKGNTGVLRHTLQKMHACNEKNGIIKFMSTYQGFTLMDMVSYEFKHNEENGENNQDGMVLNESCNYGEEGATQKKKIKDLRIKQIKNAYLMLLFGTGTPMFFMGDEFGNTQNGNNNPYCQDNSTTWLNWKHNTSQKDLLATFKELTAMRENYPVLQSPKPYQMTDTLGCGFPDVSYHGEEAWKMPPEYKDSFAGIFYAGEYDDSKPLFVAMNMLKTKQFIALPNLSGKKKWKAVYSTDKKDKNMAMETSLGEGILVDPHTICLLTY